MPRDITVKATKQGDFICADDGFFVYWPRGLGGALSAEDLRQLADALDGMNAAWAAEVERELTQGQRPLIDNSLLFPYGPFERGSGE